MGEDRQRCQTPRLASFAGGRYTNDGNIADNLKGWPGLSFPVSGRGGYVSRAMPAVADEASTNLPAVPGLG